ncbi:MAG: hypothetical protein NZ703_04595 [Gemmataceae bacterium]|nr:hypothetical protein [Gemmataceae bacterium]MCS7270343.1 hypothetical protein [Gemmataceae bacterium]MDW8242780.1 hypothetical protein [Thermogemmata sp.]
MKKPSRWWRGLPVGGLLLGIGAVLWPAAPQCSATTVPYAAEAMALTRILTDLFRRHLPDPLAQSSENWGHQKEVSGTRRRIKDWRIITEPYQERRNEGLWRRLTLRVPQRDRLQVGVQNISFPRRGCVEGTVLTVAENVALQLEQQHWCNGLRLYACDIRAHCKAGLTLQAAVSSRQERPLGALLPTYVLKVHVHEARLDYADLKVDHILGLDGKAAQVVGDTIRELIRRFKPDFENQLRRRAEAAVIRATDNRELYLTLDEWLRRAWNP